VFCLLVAAAGPKGSLRKQLGTKIQIKTPLHRTVKTRDND
jgi:hypothetical protein